MSAFTFTISPAIHERSISLEKLWAQNEGKRITVGIAIVAKALSLTDSFKSKLLFLQRAANEDAYPNVYELPGGNWEKSDETILHTVAREALEETGSEVTAICTEFDGFEYMTVKPGRANSLTSNNNSDASGEPPEPTLNAEEHQVYVWVEEGDDLEKFPMSDINGMRTVVQNALMQTTSAIYS
ncbi:hypothetical protein K435DRAFT_689390 [Dendrothele bispora CBS 962.96]|uniref:Nudix hydrolase domain-containing protein n=1 Tax=Dendrothele bispora (strain CBS 962.96) TaxID=1314807 RepID=A0A4S8L539_DENBC|nr:hypothetical protein K435DRAFT_689390 [Dendrothele bispora CBS 962.96]